MAGAVLHIRKRKEILTLEILFSSLREVLECSPLGFTDIDIQTFWNAAHRSHLMLYPEISYIAASHGLRIKQSPVCPHYWRVTWA